MGTSSSHLSSPRYSKTTAKQSPEGLRHRLAKFAEQFAESSRVDPQGALAKISALQDPLATLAIDAWASAQVSRAGEAVRLIESSPNRDIATIVLRQLVRRLGSLLPADEVKRLVGPTGMLSEAAIQELLKEGIEEANLELAISSFMSRGVVEGDSRQFLMQVARWNPKEAAILSSQLLTSNQLHSGMAEVAGVWMRADPDGAIHWLQSLESSLRAKVMPPLVKDVVANNPHAIAALAQGISPEQWDPSSIARIADRWTRMDPEMATRWLGSMTNLSSETVSEAFGPTIADPAVAEAYLRNLGHLQPPPGFEGALARATFPGMTAGQVLEWSQTLSNSVARQAAFVAGLMKGAQADPEFIARNVDTWLPSEPESRDKFLSLLGARWITEDFERAWSWLQENAGSAKSAIPDALTAALKSEQLDLGRVSQSMLEWFARQPAEALNSASALAAAKTLSTEYFQQIGNPAEVANVLMGLPEGPAKESALLTLVRNSTIVDPYSASEWISTMQTGSLKDKAVEALVRAIPNDPETALLWASTITDSGSRVRLVHDAYAELWSLDPALAARTVQRTPLSGEDIAKLQELLR